MNLKDLQYIMEYLSINITINCNAYSCAKTEVKQSICYDFYHVLEGKYKKIYKCGHMRKYKKIIKDLYIIYIKNYYMMKMTIRNLFLKIGYIKN